MREVRKDQEQDRLRPRRPSTSPVQRAAASRTALAATDAPVERLELGEKKMVGVAIAAMSNDRAHTSTTARDREIIMAGFTTLRHRVYN